MIAPGGAAPSRFPLYRPPKPVVTVDEHGVKRLHGRRPGIIVDRKLYCPELHEIRLSAPILEDQPLQCDHRPPIARQAHGPMCGIMLYALAGMELRNGKHIKLILEVHYEELRWMEKHRMQPDEILYYLGVVWGPAPGARPGRP